MKKDIHILLLFFFFFGYITYAQEDYKFYFYRADALNSKVFWKCGKHDGVIKIKEGGFVLEDSIPVGGLFVIDMNSIKDLDIKGENQKTPREILENTLKNEFFEVMKYPYAVFELQKVEKIKEELYELTGDFTMHGVTNCISFNAKIQLEDNIITMTSQQFTIDRTDWGIYRMSEKNPYIDDENGWTVKDEIDLKIELTAKKE